MIAISLAIFFVFVYPANRATQNWTMTPPDWEVWRFQWEWGHTVAAVCIFLVFLALAWCSAIRKDGD
jgi:heme A synthase